MNFKINQNWLKQIPSYMQDFVIKINNLNFEENRRKKFCRDRNSILIGKEIRIPIKQPESKSKKQEEKFNYNFVAR
jgi:hypothetical protein